jgi:hypothetical protein
MSAGLTPPHLATIIMAMHAARYHLILFQAPTERDPLSYFSAPLLYHIQEQLERIDTPVKETAIDVWLESSGGDANAAYRMVLALRCRCSRLQAIIPNVAKSAATLFALGTEAIYMAPAAELGPLDAQIQHPEKENMRVSALDVTNALQWIGRYAVNSVVRGGAEILRWTDLTRQDVLREFLGFTAEFLQPLVQKLDPHLLHRAANELRIARDYAVRLLTTRRLEHLDAESAAALASHLVEDYPAHDFVICRDEARENGLPVLDLENYDRKEAVRTLFRRFQKQWLGNVPAASPSCVQLIRDDELAGALQQPHEPSAAGEHTDEAHQPHEVADRPPSED